jgi:hypothetical protein
MPKTDRSEPWLATKSKLSVGWRQRHRRSAGADRNPATPGCRLLTVYVAPTVPSAELATNSVLYLPSAIAAGCVPVATPLPTAAIAPDFSSMV